MAITSWSGPTSGAWTIVSPAPSGATLTAPAPPAALSSFAPAAGATFGSPTVYAMSGLSGASSYADLVRMATKFQRLSGCVSGPFIPRARGQRQRRLLNVP